MADTWGFIQNGFYQTWGNGDIKINVIIEYVNDKNKWEKILDIDENYCEKYSGVIESWELYNKETFENISDAIARYMRLYMDPRTYEIKMWIDIEDEQGNMREESFEPEGLFKGFIRRMVNEDTAQQLRQIERENERLREDNKLLEGFANFDDRMKEWFKEYCKIEEGKDEEN